MEARSYETVFILTPVLSEDQMKDTVAKFRKVLEDNDAEIVSEEHWGLKKLAYEIDHKSTGFYALFEFKSAPTLVKTLELEMRRDEKVLRFLTTVLDKHALEYSTRRRRGEFNKKKEETSEEAQS